MLCDPQNWRAFTQFQHVLRDKDIDRVTRIYHRWHICPNYDRNCDRKISGIVSTFALSRNHNHEAYFNRCVADLDLFYFARCFPVLDRKRQRLQQYLYSLDIFQFNIYLSSVYESLEIRPTARESNKGTELKHSLPRYLPNKLPNGKNKALQEIYAYHGVHCRDFHSMLYTFSER